MSAIERKAEVVSIAIMHRYTLKTGASAVRISGARPPRLPHHSLDCIVDDRSPEVSCGDVERRLAFDGHLIANEREARSRTDPNQLEGRGKVTDQNRRHSR